jgi:hypothetical protein
LKNIFKHIQQLRSDKPEGKSGNVASFKSIWMIVMFLCLSHYLFAEQIDIAIFKSETPNEAEIKIMPDFQINANQTISAILYTVRWEDPSVTIEPEYIFPYFIPFSGDTVHYNGYVYQVFAATPMIAVGDDILPGEEVLVSSFTFTGNNCGFFEIIENDWTQANNADYYIELLGSDKTGIIYNAIINYGSVGGFVEGGGNILLGENTGSLALNDHIGAVLHWQKQLNSGAWENIEGTSSLIAYSEVPSEAGTWNYRAVVQSNDCPPEYSEPATVVVISANGWIGLAGTAWGDPANWTAGIPDSTTNIIIQEVGSGNYPLINGQAECMDIFLQPGATLTLAPVAQLTVYGSFNNEAGSNALLIQSDADGTGSLIHHNPGVQANVQHYMPGWNTWPPEQQDTHGRFLISSMVESQAIQPGFVPDPPSLNEIFYKWDEPLNVWISSAIGSAPPFSWNPDFESEFQIGNAYLAGYANTSIQLFHGDLIVDDIACTGLTHNPVNEFPGWHLLGNPFISAIDWFHEAWNFDNIGKYAQYWDQESASYKVMLENALIPAGAGFMVYCTENGNGSITIPAAARIHYDQAQLKNIRQEKILLIANDSEGGTYQQTIIRINPDASFTFNPQYDVTFMQGYAPAFYSRSEDQKKLAVNTVPFIDAKTIPLEFIKNTSDDFSIVLQEHISGYPMLLYDLKMNIWHNLTENPVYQFNADDDDDPARFELHFETVGTTVNVTDKIQVFSNQNYLHIHGIGSDNMLIKIYDLAGRQVKSLSARTNEESFYLDLRTGIYMVTLQSKDVQMVQKILIQMK